MVTKLDMHSLCAWMVFRKECEACGCKSTKEIKEKAPQWRKKVKSVEFAKQFGGGSHAIMDSIGCSKQEADAFSKAYDEGFKGVTTFKLANSYLTKKRGYVLICKYTGHKMYWEDWEKWRAIEDLPDYEYDCEPKSVRDEHRKAGAYWDRMSLNAPTQGTGIICLKYAMIRFFQWILKNNYFNIVKICNLIHDEAVVEYPEELESTVVPKLRECMEQAAAVFCKKLPIPAEPETGKFWIH